MREEVMMIPRVTQIRILVLWLGVAALVWPACTSDSGQEQQKNSDEQPGMPQQPGTTRTDTGDTDSTGSPGVTPLDTDGNGAIDGVDVTGDGKPDTAGLEECIEELRDGGDVDTFLDCVNEALGDLGKKDPPTGNPPTGNPPTGNPPTGNPPTGNPPTGNPPTGNPPGDGNATSCNIDLAVNNEQVKCVDGTCTCYRDGAQVGKTCQLAGCDLRDLEAACCWAN
jgi:hypothetical protein